MRTSILIAALFFAALQNRPPTPTKLSKQQQSGAHKQPVDSDQPGTEQSPIVVKTLEPTKSQAEAKQEAQNRQQKTTNDGRVLTLTGVLAAVAVGQLGVYLYQAIKLRETVAAAGEQSKAMYRHIGEAARSADAMERIATTIDAGNKAIIRAYLTVTIGSALYQERRPGQGDLKFEARPNLVNTGNTPARKVRVTRRKAQILPVPLPANFDFPLPDDGPAQGDAAVGAHLTYTMNCIVDDFIPNAEVQAVKEGVGQALYVWGRVTYEDIFGGAHFTKFAQQLYWLPDNTVMGFYVPSRNDAD